MKHYKRSDAIILWQVFHSFRKDKRGRVNCLAFKDELTSHGFNKYVKTIFGYISETDMYDTFFSFIDMLQRMVCKKVKKKRTIIFISSNIFAASGVAARGVDDDGA